jgi:hypothetical protein
MRRSRKVHVIPLIKLVTFSLSTILLTFYLWFNLTIASNMSPPMNSAIIVPVDDKSSPIWVGQERCTGLGACAMDVCKVSNFPRNYGVLIITNEMPVNCSKSTTEFFRAEMKDHALTTILGVTCICSQLVFTFFYCVARSPGAFNFVDLTIRILSILSFIFLIGVRQIAYPAVPDADGIGIMVVSLYIIVNVIGCIPAENFLKSDDDKKHNLDKMFDAIEQHSKTEEESNRTNFVDT